MECVQQWLQEGKLLHPLEDYNLINLTEALGILCGIPPRFQESQQLLDQLQINTETKHVIFLLLDGLGVVTLEQHFQDHESMLKDNIKTTIRSVFPATTAAAVTAVATAKYPGEHGLLGWNLVHKDGQIYQPLPFIYRETEESLPVEDVDWVFKDIVPHFTKSTTRTTSAFSAFADTLFSSVAFAFNGVQCDTPREMFDQLEAFIRNENGPTFSYVYLNEPDHAEHAVGYTHEDVKSIILFIEDELKRFLENTADIADERLVIVSADHGHMEVTQDDQLILCEEKDSEVIRCLRDLISVEHRSPVFKVHPEYVDDFPRIFAESRLAEHYALLTAEEVRNMKLLGPNLGDVAQENLGDFMALTINDRVIVDTLNAHIGYHGGMTPGEMRIPVITLQ